MRRVFTNTYIIYYRDKYTGWHTQTGNIGFHIHVGQEHILRGYRYILRRNLVDKGANTLSQECIDTHLYRCIYT